LTYVVDTAPKPVAELAQQAIDALTDITELIDTPTREPAATITPTDPLAVHHADPPADTDPPANTDAAVLAAKKHLLRSALVVGKTSTATRATKLERKHNNLFTRMIDRWDDYLRFAHDQRVPFDNNPAEQTIRMPNFASRSPDPCAASTAPRTSQPSAPTPPPPPAPGRTCSTPSSKPPPAPPGSPPSPDRPTPTDTPTPRADPHPRGTSSCPKTATVRSRDLSSYTDARPAHARCKNVGHG
jgi:hypothetical protein